MSARNRRDPWFRQGQPTEYDRHAERDAAVFAARHPILAWQVAAMSEREIDEAITYRPPRATR